MPYAWPGAASGGGMAAERQLLHGGIYRACRLAAVAVACSTHLFLLQVSGIVQKYILFAREAACQRRSVFGILFAQVIASEGCF
jgi:hypothetical protein